MVFPEAMGPEIRIRVNEYTIHPLALSPAASTIQGWGEVGYRSCCAGFRRLYLVQMFAADGGRPDVLGAAPAPTAPGRPPFRVAGTGVAGQAGAGRTHSRRQQARNASFQGQVRLIFSTRARAWRTSRAGRLSSR